MPIPQKARDRAGRLDRYSIFRPLEVIDTFTSLLGKLGVVGNLLLAGLSAGGITAGIASLTQWMAQYSPLSYWIAFLRVALIVPLVIVSVLWLSTAYRLHLAKIRFFRTREATTSRINPLEEHFEKEQIDIKLFENPFREWNERKSFVRCNLYGPAVIVSSPATMIGCKFIECDPLLIDDNKNVKNAIGFKDSFFTNCVLYHLTILVPRSQRVTFKEVPGGEVLDLL